MVYLLAPDAVPVIAPTNPPPDCSKSHSCPGTEPPLPALSVPKLDEPIPGVPPTVPMNGALPNVGPQQRPKPSRLPPKTDEGQPSVSQSAAETKSPD